MAQYVIKLIWDTSEIASGNQDCSLGIDIVYERKQLVRPELIVSGIYGEKSITVEKAGVYTVHAYSLTPGMRGSATESATLNEDNTAAEIRLKLRSN